jgi:PAS domain S-box-containing protein
MTESQHGLRGSHRPLSDSGSGVRRDPSALDARALVTQFASPVALLEGEEHVFVAASASYRRMLGGRDPIGRRFHEVLPELAEQGFAERLDDVFESGTTQGGRDVVVFWDEDGDGESEEHVVDYVYQPVVEADGRISGIVIQITDRTAQARLDQERAFLAEASDVLASSLDYDVTLSAVTRLAVRGIADWCAMDELMPDGTVRRISVAHPDPEMVRLAHRLQEQYPPETDAAYGVAQVLRTGEPELVRDIPDELLVAAARDEEHLRLVRALGLRSYIVVPLIARGAVLGALTLVASESGRRFGERELRLAEELAGRAATAIDNARLYHESESARLRLEEQAIELEVQGEELRLQATYLEEAQAELEVSNEELAASADAADEARREAESARALVDAFFTAAPVAAGFLDRDSRYVRVNPALAEIDGSAPDALLGKRLAEVAPAIAPLLEPLYRQVLETGEPVSNREIVAPRRADPATVGHFLVNFFPVRVGKDEPMGVGLVLLDLTDLRQAEERERVFAQVLEEARNEIYLFDAETLRFERVNRGARENLGYSMEEMRELTPVDLKPEYTMEQFSALVEPLRRGQRDVLQFETVHRRKDGTLYPADVHLQLSTAGKRPLFVALIFDVTERKRAERAIYEGQERLRAVVETAVDGIITIDERGTIETVNPATERIFGYTEAEVVGRNISMLMPEPYRSEHDGYLERYRQTGERKIIGQGREVMGQRRDGTTFPLDLAVSETLLEGRRLFTGLVRDITERARAAEELLAATKAAEQASRAKSQFLTVMSHELRTPLNAIIGYQDLLEAGVAGPVTPQQQAHLARIKSGAGQLLELINQILSLARIESGKEDVIRETVDLVELATEVKLFLEGLAEQKGLSLRTEFEVSHLDVETDGGKVRQILLNLLGNALKFTEEGEVELSLAVQGGEVAFRIRDTGSGIPEAFQEQVFDPFVQADNSQTRRHGGTGLGLSVSRELARLLGGDLVLEHTSEAGSTFLLTLPAG